MGCAGSKQVEQSEASMPSLVPPSKDKRKLEEEFVHREYCDTPPSDIKRRKQLIARNNQNLNTL